MPTTFHTPINDLRTTVATARTAGAGTLAVADGSGFGSPSPSAPVRVSLFRGETALTILQVTGRTGNTLTIAGALEGTTDVNLIVGDVVEVECTAGTIAELQTAINTISLTPGPQGSAGAQGVQGVQGVQGAAGAAGSQGPQGYQGSAGPQGYQGYQGATSSQGPQGYQGSTGATGSQGPQGSQGATGPVGGSDTQVVYNASGTAAGDAGLTYSASNDRLTVTGGADATRLLLKAHSTQTNPVMEVQSSSSVVQASIGGTGTYTLRNPQDTNNPFTIGAATSGEPVINFKYGATSVFGVRSNAQILMAQGFTNNNIDYGTSGNPYGLNRGNNKLTLSDTSYAAFDLTADSQSYSHGTLRVTSGAAGVVALAAKGAPSQSANLFEARNSSDTVVASISPAGVLTGTGSGLTSLNASNLSSGTVATARLGSGTASSSTYLRGDQTWAAIGGGGGGGGTPGGSSGQLQWNNAGSLDGTAALAYATSGTHLTATAQSASDVPVVVKGAASQSGALTQWQNSSSTVLLSVDPYGRPVSGGTTPSYTLGTGAGTGATLSITGNDFAGCFLLTTGTSPTNNATVVTITFANAYGATPKAILLTPGSPFASIQWSRFYVDTVSTTAWTIANSSNSAALTGSTQFKVYYQAIG